MISADTQPHIDARGACDWGCQMPGCGKKMSFCDEHYRKLSDRLESVQALCNDEITRRHELEDEVERLRKALLAFCEVDEITSWSDIPKRPTEEQRMALFAALSESVDGGG